MAKKKAEPKEPKEVKEKKSDIFTLISYLTWDKKTWDNLTVEEQKLFNPYIVNRFLSMDLYLCEAINELQRYTINVMEKQDIWRLYYTILPKDRLFLKYIKSEADSNKVIDVLIKYFKLSRRECEEYYDLLIKHSVGRDELEYIQSNFMYENKK